MSNIIPTEAERLAQQLVSEKDDTEPLTALAADATREDLGEIDIPGTVDDGIDSEDEFKPLLLSEMLAGAAGDIGMVRLKIKPELNFVLNLFADDIHDELVNVANFTNGDEVFNIIQPLAKKNEKSGRIGVLREPMREFIHVLGEMLNHTETIVVSPESGSLVIDALVTEFVSVAENTLFTSFPQIAGKRAIPVDNTDGSGYLLEANNYVRVTSLIEGANSPTEDGLVNLAEVTVKFIVHLRVPLMLRESSDKFEKTMKTHFKYLENSGIKLGIPTTIYASFNSVDLAGPQVAHALNWIREADPAMEVLSYRNAEQGGDFFGIDGFNSDDYADALFNGGDFIVAFNLENAGE
jgi:hypothetical protein